MGRLLTGATALGLLLLIRGEGWPVRAAWPGVAASGVLWFGVLWFGVYMVALNAGEESVDAGTAAMIVNIGPILIAVFGGWLLREGFSRRVFVGMALSFLGAVVVGLSFADKGSAPVFGVLLCLVAAVSYAGGAVSQMPALRHASALQVTTFGCLIGAIGCLPFAGRMGATTYAVPAVVVVLSGLLLSEVPGPITLAGGALCLVGVAVSRQTGRKTRRLGLWCGNGERGHRPAVEVGRAVGAVEGTRGGLR